MKENKGWNRWAEKEGQGMQDDYLTNVLIFFIKPTLFSIFQILHYPAEGSKQIISIALRSKNYCGIANETVCHHSLFTNTITIYDI